MGEQEKTLSEKLLSVLPKFLQALIGWMGEHPRRCRCVQCGKEFWYYGPYYHEATCSSSCERKFSLDEMGILTNHTKDTAWEWFLKFIRELRDRGVEYKTVTVIEAAKAVATYRQNTGYESPRL